MTDLLDPLPAEPGTRRKANTRARLVRASLPVFVNRGIDGATIDDLVSAAGFTRGAFYSNFSRKEEVFHALFEMVTSEIIEQISGALPPDADALSTQRDSERMVGIFEAIRPFGRQWYLLYSEAVTHAMRSEEARDQLNVQRHRLHDVIAETLQRGMELTGQRSVIPLRSLAQTLMGIYVDLMVQEQMDGADVTEISGRLILGTLEAFLEPVPAEE